MAAAVRQTVTFALGRVASPLGRLLLASDGEALRALDFADYEPRMLRLLRLHYGAVALRPGEPVPLHRAALESYFAGRLDALDAVGVATGGTPFQCAVWAALRGIAPATTLSYGRLAQRLGQAGAGRAVGLANGANPIAIVVPCHRVAGADGRLTGFGGGLPRKRWLLDHEAAAGGQRALFTAAG